MSLRRRRKYRLHTRCSSRSRLISRRPATRSPTTRSISSRASRASCRKSATRTELLRTAATRCSSSSRRPIRRSSSRRRRRWQARRPTSFRATPNTSARWRWQRGNSLLRNRPSTRRGRRATLTMQPFSTTRQASRSPPPISAYTQVNAPFDGVVTAHEVSVGDLVGQNTTTKLATIVQLDPIYVTFNVSEQDVLRVRAALRERGVTIADLGKVPVEIGLMTENGYPHAGTIDYISPMLDTQTGNADGARSFCRTRTVPCCLAFSCACGCRWRLGGAGAAGSGNGPGHGPERPLSAGRRQGRCRSAANGNDRPTGRHAAGDRLRIAARRPCGDLRAAARHSRREGGAADRHRSARMRSPPLA